jgi:NAD(P)-dependent dehydrogenase (short-subunit alcohol dehydrogenase family)
LPEFEFPATSNRNPTLIPLNTLELSRTTLLINQNPSSHFYSITMASYLITGASRGLGLELARQLSSLPTSQVGKVFATTRGDAAGLNELVEKSSGKVVVVKLDATKPESVKQAAADVETQLGGKGLDVLINNAGIMPATPNGVVTM